MDYQLFRSHFRAAVTKAQDFARQLVAESLPDAMRFRIHLNFPRCDYSCREGEFVYPEDAAYQRQKSVSDCSEFAHPAWDTCLFSVAHSKPLRGQRIGGNHQNRRQNQVIIIKSLIIIILGCPNQKRQVGQNWRANSLQRE
jgi:hypothetical protein